MQYNDYFRILKNNFILIAVIAALTFASALFFSATKERFFQFSLPLFVSSGVEFSAPLKAEDPYYSVKASDGAAEALTAWLQSPSAQKSLSSQVKVFKNFKVIKFAPQFLEVKYEAKSEEDGRRLAQAVLAEADKSINYLGKIRMFAIKAEELAVAQEERRAGVTAFLGMLTGLALGIFLAFVKEYLNNN